MSKHRSIFFSGILFLFVLLFGIFTTKNVYAQTGCECGENGSGGCRQNCQYYQACSRSGCYNILTGYIECNGPNDCAGSGCSGGKCGAKSNPDLCRYRRVGSRTTYTTEGYGYGEAGACCLPTEAMTYSSTKVVATCQGDGTTRETFCNLYALQTYGITTGGLFAGVTVSRYVSPQCTPEVGLGWLTRRECRIYTCTPTCNTNPSTITSVTRSANGTQATINWNPGAGADVQRLFMTPDSTKITNSFLNSINYSQPTINVFYKFFNNNTTKTHTTTAILDPYTIYYFKMGSYADTCKDYSATYTLPVACNTTAPTGLTVTRTGNTSATLNWTPGTGASSQEVYIDKVKSNVDGNCKAPLTCFKKIVFANNTTNSYATGNVLAAGTVYYYRVANFGGTCTSNSGTVTALSSCNTTTPSITLPVDASATLTSSVLASSYISNVAFSGGSAYFSITSTTPDASYPFAATIKALVDSAPGSNNLTSQVYSPGIVNPICTATTPITTTPSSAWWQVKDSDLSVNGSLISFVPGAGKFGLPGAGLFPGIPAYSSSTNLDITNVSAKGWLAQSGVSNPKLFDYRYFANLIPAGTTINTLSSNVLDQGAIDAGSQDASSLYYWFKYSGAGTGLNLSVDANLNIGSKKVILLVDSANFNVNANINLTDGQGFFMAVIGNGADNGKGNIIVDPGVGSGTSINPNLEGLYVADGSFSTSVAATVLYVRGSVVGYNSTNGVNLQRNLGAAANANPSEVFEYAPDQIMFFPKAFSTRKINWKEVAP